MYLHRGQEIVIRLCDIIGIFDIENSTVKKSSKDFLTTAQQQGRVVNVSSELPKSFVVCQEDEETVVYISQISSATLRKRTGFLKDFSCF